MLVVIHSGQTGVERGAHRAAATVGLGATGFSTLDERDELGPLPHAIASALTPCRERGSRAAVRANLLIASGLVVVIPNRNTPDRFTAMRNLLGSARSHGVPYAVVDPTSDLDDVRKFVEALAPTSGTVRLMVTGPRATRWAAGERTAWQVVARMAIA
ncbi:MAG TPA: putative molybdenum carrier protein [Kofleriaceae bacterium]